jgi:hypothetical protein
LIAEITIIIVVGLNIDFPAGCQEKDPVRGRIKRLLCRK